jgi:RNA polymerase sigma-70 factor (ECF subfamily)
MDEREAVQRLKQGDLSGLEHLVYRCQVQAIRTAFLITRDAGLAEEIVQESFLRAYRAIRGFDNSRPFGPWFMCSVINATLKTMQRSERLVEFAPGGDEGIFAELAVQAATVESQVESAELSRRVWDAMERLSPRQRAAIVQRYFLEMSEKEMAEQGGTAVGTVKWLLNAARERLRGILVERSDE